MSPTSATMVWPRPALFGVWYAAHPGCAAAAFERAGVEAGLRVVLEPDGLGGVLALAEGRLPVVFVTVARHRAYALLN
ncbi:MAG: hypothetical protein SF182_01640 [Deltaproteobacteria bacterium]|nr:hypothetical protein [Deltaproteobacteria bacterium]